MLYLAGIFGSHALDATAIYWAPQGSDWVPGDTQIGGYYLLDVPSEREATGWAAQCPAAQFGAIEVRQVAFSPL